MVARRRRLRRQSRIDFLLPMSGPNAQPPSRMTANERITEAAAILARGAIRMASAVKRSASTRRATPGTARP